MASSISPASATPGLANNTWSLFVLSVLGLFLELLLIRWVSTEIRIFAYWQNTVLVVCFMGLGIGCWTCREPVRLRQLLVPLFILVLLLTVPTTRIFLGYTSEMLNVFQDMPIWYSAEGSWLYFCFGLLLAFIMLALIWDIFVPIGRLLGRLMDDHPRIIWAYSVNVAGSLAGIWLFVLLSAFHLPPMAWFAAAAVMALCFVGRAGWERRLDVLLLAAIVGLSWLATQEIGMEQVIWSPYQKLALQKVQPNQATAKKGLLGHLLTRETDTIYGGMGEWVVRVNNVGYQVMIDLNHERTARDPQRYKPEWNGQSQYDLPVLFHPGPRKVLCVGAGSGNDVAGALRRTGVAEVVAVDIDPVIVDLGKQYHPEKPYEDPRVRPVINDARAFFATTPEKFDVIVFGLLDSHTMTAMTNARLDHYVYTRESIERAKALLADDGILVLNFGNRQFIADRLARVLREVFGQEPLVFPLEGSNYGPGGTMFITGNVAAAQRQLDDNPRLKTMLDTWKKEKAVDLPGTTPIATDDWPYLYLEKPAIPNLYYCLAGLLLVLFWRGTRQAHVPELWKRWGRAQAHFFFLGAAFLLLEVQNISKASVVLGNTWQVNAVIISGILIMILLANAFAAQFPRLPLAGVYGLLCASCLSLYFVDISQFAFLPYVSKAAIVGGLTSLPMFFSGIVFIRSFAAVDRKDVALGANLMGAMVGGLLQSITFVTGIKALLLIVAGLYLAAFLSRPRVTVEKQLPAVPEPV